MERLAPFCVYLITCTVNGKQYVGKAADPERRWYQHRQKDRRSAHRPLYRAMRKYGTAAFTAEVLSWHQTAPEAFATEIETIARLRTKTPYGYNLTDGGEGASGSVSNRGRTFKWGAEAKAEHAKRWGEYNERKRYAHVLHLGRLPCTAFSTKRVCKKPSEVVARRSQTNQHRGLVAANEGRSAACVNRNREIVAAYVAGATLRALEKQFGLSRRQIAEAVKRTGVMRPVGRPAPNHPSDP